jgi:hypothetical protein
MSWLFWKGREALEQSKTIRRTADFVVDDNERAAPTPGAPTVTYVCNTYRCPQKGTQVTLELSLQGGFVIGNMPPICQACGKNASKESTAGIGHL